MPNSSNNKITKKEMIIAGLSGMAVGWVMGVNSKPYESPTAPSRNVNPVNSRSIEGNVDPKTNESWEKLKQREKEREERIKKKIDSYEGVAPVYVDSHVEQYSHDISNTARAFYNAGKEVAKSIDEAVSN